MNLDFLTVLQTGGSRWFLYHVPALDERKSIIDRKGFKSFLLSVLKVLLPPVVGLHLPSRETDPATGTIVPPTAFDRWGTGLLCKLPRMLKTFV